MNKITINSIYIHTVFFEGFLGRSPPSSSLFSPLLAVALPP
jgi:hypothetical protein